MESSVAILLFLLTPGSWFKQLSRYIPGTEEHANEQQQYLQKVRNVTAKRVEQFSEVFEALSKSFSSAENYSLEEEESQRETDYFLSNVTEKTCQTCFMKERCWQQQFDTTYSLMDMLKQNVETGNEPNRKVLREFENHCIKSRKVIDTMKEEMSYFEANRKLRKKWWRVRSLLPNSFKEYPM